MLVDHLFVDECINMYKYMICIYYVLRKERNERIAIEEREVGRFRCFFFFFRGNEADTQRRGIGHLSLQGLELRACFSFLYFIFLVFVFLVLSRFRMSFSTLLLAAIRLRIWINTNLINKKNRIVYIPIGWLSDRTRFSFNGHSKLTEFSWLDKEKEFQIRWLYCHDYVWSCLCWRRRLMQCSLRRQESDGSDFHFRQIESRRK